MWHQHQQQYQRDTTREKYLTVYLPFRLSQQQLLNQQINPSSTEENTTISETDDEYNLVLIHY